MFKQNQKLQVMAPAKINLFLEVLGCRENGYHDIRSIAIPVSIYDEVTVAVADAMARGRACAMVRVLE